MFKKIVQLVLLPVWITLFTETIDLAIYITGILFGFTYEPNIFSDAFAETFIYQPLYGLSQLPLIGSMVEIVLWIAVFEFALWILRFIFRVLEWSTISGRSVLEA